MPIRHQNPGFSFPLHTPPHLQTPACVIVAAGQSYSETLALGRLRLSRLLL
ncbi:predicted protein [Plenodomus lingam JN3]|uniref:Predicted protein n=1 Tax=Leptosphaeria maculans (strain JN3 / isolate v23.1.3 / race Av1-4-5-6-7-8) TaxID=985895 RepID=E4ZHM1_LEPMJ|nr:predicted protein [Plenodomus lingam JN3]CBX90854.1 predicted protein [Plenodomus lingam JN3]